MGAIGRKLTGETSRQARAEAQILEEQQRQFDLTREDFSGILERGNLAGEDLAASLGLRGAEAEQAFISNFQESPGQAFLRERQEKALVRREAALGGLGGGNVRTALQEQAFDIANTQLGQRQSQLGALAGVGAQSTASAAGIGAGISGQTSNLLNSFNQRRAAQSAQDLQAAGGALTAFLSDRRLKTNIKRIGERNGYPWYSFDYLWGESSEGVMSDEIPQEFVTQVGGFDIVDYGALF